MPYKDKTKQRESNKLRMQKVRGNTEQGNTTEGNTEQGITWETISLEDIKSILPQDIVSYILRVGERFGNTEIRLRRAYKYKVWHDANFINGIHKDLVEVTR